MIEKAPKIRKENLDKAIRLFCRDDVASLLSVINEEYLYWDKAKYKPRPKDISDTELWACIKLSRMVDYKTIRLGRYSFVYRLTNYMQQICHQFDMYLGGYMGTQNIIPEEDKNRYLVSSVMEEAIASSQMEGAATTRKVAKDMLRKESKPRNKSEQMIVNNFRSIHFIVEHKQEDLTPELLLQIHHHISEDTLDNKNDEGCFRQTNDIEVVHIMKNEVVHTPPPYQEIPRLIEELCLFFNNNNSSFFIHPIIKGIIIHFMVGYIHPFVDGNGRTARALFYWYMLKQGYWLTEYLSISRIISKSKNQYEKAYLYTENDDNDLSYFITYHLKVMDQAFSELRTYIQKKINEKKQTSDFLRIGNMNERQAQILKWLNDDSSLVFTVKDIQNRFMISNPTARADLNGLKEAGFIEIISTNKIKQTYIRSKQFDALLQANTSYV